MSDKTMKVINLTRPQNRPVHAKWCQSYFSRLRGFTFRFHLEKDEGLVLVDRKDSKLDASIHMLFVWTDLSVVWINSNFEVVDSVLAKAWHPYYAPAAPARYVLEFHPDRLGDFQKGDRISFIEPA